MIPYNLLPLIQPHTEEIACHATSGSLFAAQGRVFSRLSSGSLAQIYAFQPHRLIIAVLMLILLAVAATGLAVGTLNPDPAGAAEASQVLLHGAADTSLLAL